MMSQQGSSYFTVKAPGASANAATVSPTPALASGQKAGPLKISSSRLMGALHRFTNGFVTEVRNPLALRYGEAYELLIAGDGHLCREEWDAAIGCYRQALTLREDFTEAAVGLARCLKRKGDCEGAVRHFRNALAKTPFDRDLHIDLAKCYNDLGRLPEAIREYERAVKLDPSHIEARFGLALVVELNSNLEYAARLYREIIARDPQFLPSYNNLGSICLRQGEYEEAEHLFRELTRLAPDFPRGYLGLALTLDRAGRTREALDVYLHVLTLKPGSRNVDYIEKRILTLNTQLGRTKTRGRTTLVRVK
jgi:tetratricopeptide (TPR) repeat protein